MTAHTHVSDDHVKDDRPVAVSTRSLTVGYGGRPVLRGIDFDIPVGDVVALLGPNGSGKSTLVRAILGLVPLTSGSLRLFGVDAAQFGDRARIGYVPQRDTIAGGVPATVEEIVAAGRLGRRRILGPFLRSADRTIVSEAIATVGLTEKARQPVATLSGGQQRRTLIARALASEPELLIMDEPLAGVDAANIEILVGSLNALVKRDVTIILVTHELGPVRSLLRRTLVLRHGEVGYDGPPERVDDTPSDADPHGPAGTTDDGLGLQQDLAE